MDSKSAVVLTKDVISAYLANNTIAAKDLTGLIKSVHQTILDLSQDAETGGQAPKSAVNIDDSVSSHSITCLECGARMKLLRRHILTDHRMTVDAYRARWGLSANYPLVAPAYSERRREIALAMKLGSEKGRGRSGKSLREGH